MGTETDEKTSNLAKSILHTMAFFAAQGKALTLLELQGSLARVDPGQTAPTLFELRETIARSLSSEVAEENGLYFLKTHNPDLQSRLEKYKRTAELFRKASQWVYGLRYVPFVRAAAVCGSTAQFNASPESDIDLFIIVAPGRVFLARFLVSVYFQIFGGRRHGEYIIGRFCLNHYIACGLVLDRDRNLYTAELYISLIPIFGRRYFEEFWSKNNFWIEQFVLGPKYPISPVFKARRSQNIFQYLEEFLLWPFAGALEKLAKFLQKRRIRQSETVFVTDAELSFHPESKGQRILGRFREILGHYPPG